MQKTLLILLVSLPCFSCMGQTDLKPGSSEVKMIRENEPGKPFTLDITILDIDTRQPVSGTEVYAYQTNHKGDYENDKNGLARIRGTAFSDANGNIRFITIYPRGYNDSPTGEHIHFRVKADGYKSAGADLNFADYYRQRYDFNNPYTYKVYLKTLEEKDGKYRGAATIYMKKS